LKKCSRVIAMTDKDDVCQDHTVDDGKVSRILEGMPSGEVFQMLSETFKTLGNTTRIRILHALSGVELCVCDISSILGMSISAVSHQLRLLRNMKLVKFRKDGKNVHYSLDDDHVTRFITMGMEHVMEERR